MVQHKAAAPRDPTIPLVLGLAVVIAVVLLISNRPGGGDKATPVASTPSASESPTPRPTPPDPQAGTKAQKVV